jgi:hypothetical protein
MSVRAKFKISSITQILGHKRTGKKDTEGRDTWEPAEQRTIVMHPVYPNGNPAHENSEFWDATPSGEISINCANLEAAKQFELGKEYYVDFSPA